MHFWVSASSFTADDEKTNSDKGVISVVIKRPQAFVRSISFQPSHPIVPGGSEWTIRTARHFFIRLSTCCCVRACVRACVQGCSWQMKEAHDAVIDGALHCICILFLPSTHLYSPPAFSAREYQLEYMHKNYGGALITTFLSLSA